MPTVTMLANLIFIDVMSKLPWLVSDDNKDGRLWKLDGASWK